jgi:hypothetical protein
MTPLDASRLKRSLLGVALTGMLLAACGSLPLTRPGQTPNPTPTPAPTFDPELTGVDGVVVDEDGNPIQGVHIVLFEGRRRGTAATTPEGTFFSRGPGEFRIIARLDGYETEEVTVIVPPNEIREIEIVLVATGD